jgi:heterodisulfide reductase subunit D
VTPEEVLRESETASVLAEMWVCQDCGKCTAACPVARVGLGYSPRRFIQRTVRKDLDAVLFDRALFACLACDRCGPVCKSGISMANVVMKLRAIAFERGIPGQAAHAGMLQTLMRLMAKSSLPQRRLAWLDPSVKVASQGDVLYFVGCAPYFDPLFGHLGVRPLRTARNAIRLLNLSGIEPVLLPDERCCGHDLLWQGDVENFRRLAERNLEQVRASGVETVVFSCPEGLRTFKLDYPRYFGPRGFEVVHITEFLEHQGIPRPEYSDAVVTFHDPCRLGRHLGIYDPPRNLLEKIPDLELVEMPHNRVSATCCGGTCWMECGAAVKALQAQRLSEAARTGARFLVTACPKCDIHFGCAIAGSEYDGPKISNIVDLMASALGVDEPEQAAAAEKGGITVA